MKLLKKTGLTIAASSMLMTASQAAVVTFTGPTNTGNSDSYNIAARYDTITVPSGTDSLTIQTGLRNLANSAATPTYSGGLILEADSTIGVSGDAASLNALGTGSITMNTGSTIEFTGFKNDVTIGNTITLNGTTNFILENQNSGGNKSKNFTGAITGSGSLNLTSTKRNQITFSNTGNTFAGGLNATATAGGFYIVATTSGSLGTGDVSVGDLNGLQLEASNAVSDTAALYFDGGKYQYDATKLILGTGTTNTVSGLYLDGVAQAAGTYNTGNNLSYGGGSLISGAGTLIVVPEPATALLGSLGMLALLRRRR